MCVCVFAEDGENSTSSPSTTILRKCFSAAIEKQIHLPSAYPTRRMRTRRSEGGGGSSSDNESRPTSVSSSCKKEGRTRCSGRGGGGGGGCHGLVARAWHLIKVIFFTIVHIYKSLTAFWSQMNVCMLPALGELDHQEEQNADAADAEGDAAQSGSPGSSPQRKRVTSKEL